MNFRAEENISGCESA